MAMTEFTFLPADGVGFRFVDRGAANTPPDPTARYVLTLPEPGSISGAALLGPGVPAPAGSIVHIEHSDVPLNDTDALEVTAPTLGLTATTQLQPDGTFAFASVWPGICSTTPAGRGWASDAELIDEALGALLARHRAADIDAAYAPAYTAHPIDEPTTGVISSRSVARPHGD